jgi:DNA-directed RNA polymerase subunit M/transcription elongation factor TFIIS
MAQSALTPLRAGMVSVLETALAKAARALGPGDPSATADVLKPAAEQLEAAVFAAAKSTVESRAYGTIARALGQALPAQTGPFPDDVLGVKYLRGELGAGAAVKLGQAPPPAPDQRETTRWLFVRVLLAAGAAYEGERAAALEAARAIEAACFNAAVRAGRESEDPSRRSWDSPPFVSVYSSRCGLVACQLDPASQPCQRYGATLGQRLRAGEVAPEELGTLASKELCPEATAEERALLARRAAQRIEEKESNLFRCPHCGERRCTYVQIQIRSADEPPDYFCTCKNESCRRKFKGRG